MIRVLVLLAAAGLCAVLVRQPSSPGFGIGSWAEGSPEAWSKLDLSALLTSNTGFFCPMDRDVSSKSAGFCPRCGMKLVSGIPDAKEYAVHLTTEPPALRAGENAQLVFHIEDPKTPPPVREFEIVHEKFYHVFLVSQDLSVFIHTHPELQPDSSFRLGVRLPKPGMYRILSDFYPKGGTPQLVINTLMVPGEGFHLAPAKLVRDVAPRQAENLGIDMTTDPPQPRAGAKTTLVFSLTPNEGIEPYLGAMAHLLAASADLVDMIHSHPMQAIDHGSGSKELQFKITFPRASVYRVWIQSQRKGVVNTAAFTIPVSD